MVLTGLDDSRRILSQDKMMKTIRWILMLGIVCGAILVAGYRLTQFEMEASAAVSVSAPVKPSLSVQATTVQEVAVVDRTAVFEDGTFGYHIRYPLDWDKVQLSDYVVSFRSPNGASQVKVEAVGSLPADGLSPFVDRSLGNDIVISRQLLIVHSISAERVVTFSDVIGSQITTFYLDGGESVFVVTGIGEQKAIEMVARSFSIPQLVAQR
jgi:hypothetical protein